MSIPLKVPRIYQKALRALRLKVAVLLKVNYDNVIEHAVYYALVVGIRIRCVFLGSLRTRYID